MPQSHPTSESRRRFLLQSMAGALALSGFALSTDVLAAVEQQAAKLDSFKLPVVKLGNTPVRPTLMALGTGTPSDPYRKNQEGPGFDRLVNLMEYAYDRGIRFFDLAQQYRSHPHMGRALKAGGGTIPREDIVILTKVNMDYRRDDQDIAQYVRESLDTMRKEAKTEFFDIVLLHHMGIGSATGNWVEKFQPAMDVLSEEKNKGNIAALGISQHGAHYGDTQPLLHARDNPWVEVDLVRLNPWDGKLPNNRGTVMDAPVAEVVPILDVMKKRGCGLIGMKVFNLAIPEPGQQVFSTEFKNKGLNYAMTSPLLDCFTLGMDTREQVDENISLVAALLEAKKAGI